MSIRVKRPDGSWDDIPTGRIDFHDRGGALNIRTDDEAVVYAAEEWEAFESVGESDPVLVTGETEERVFPEGFV